MRMRFGNALARRTYAVLGATSGRWALAAAAWGAGSLGAGGCIRLSAFSCESSAGCDATPGGVCTVGGHCAYPDAGCVDGLRYDEHAQGDIAGTCVGPIDAGSTTVADPSGSPTSLDPSAPTTSDAATDSDTSAGESTSGADTGTSCGAAGDPCCDTGPSCDAGLTCLGSACSCVAQIEAGERHSCAVLYSGEVQCWGANDRGQLGASIEPFESSPTLALAPIVGDPIREVRAVRHTCVRSEQGNVRCFGANDSGQVDPLVPAPATPPTPAAWIPSANRLGNGVSFSCAADGVSMACWGANGSSQITGVDPGPGPVFSGTGPLSSLEIGGAFGCLIQSNTLSCWGQNDRGQLAMDPVLAPSLPGPTLMPIADVSAVALGRTHTCALTVAGSVACWGRGTEGQIGDGLGIDQIVPVTITLPPEASMPMAIEAGDQHTCVIDDAGALWCWGSNASGQLMLEPDEFGFDGYTLVPVAMDVGAVVVAVTGGVTHTCVLTDDAQVLCWGTNAEGQIGDGTTNYAFAPRPVAIDCGG